MTCRDFRSYSFAEDNLVGFLTARLSRMRRTLFSATLCYQAFDCRSSRSLQDPVRVLSQSECSHDYAWPCWPCCTSGTKGRPLLSPGLRRQQPATCNCVIVLSGVTHAGRRYDTSVYSMGQPSGISFAARAASIASAASSVTQPRQMSALPFSHQSAASLVVASLFSFSQAATPR